MKATKRSRNAAKKTPRRPEAKQSRTKRRKSSRAKTPQRSQSRGSQLSELEWNEANDYNLCYVRLLESHWEILLKQFPDLTAHTLSRVRSELEAIRYQYCFQIEKLAERPPLRHHRVLFPKLLGHAKALRTGLKKAGAPLIMLGYSMSESLAWNELFKQGLETFIYGLSTALKDPAAFAYMRGEKELGSGRKSVECQYLWDPVFALFAHYYTELSPSQNGPMFKVIAWLHWSCLKDPPNSESIKKAFQRWAALKGRK